MKSRQLTHIIFILVLIILISIMTSCCTIIQKFETPKQHPKPIVLAYDWSMYRIYRNEIMYFDREGRYDIRRGFNIGSMKITPGFKVDCFTSLGDYITLTEDTQDFFEKRSVQTNTPMYSAVSYIVITSLLAAGQTPTYRFEYPVRDIPEQLATVKNNTEIILPVPRALTMPYANAYYTVSLWIKQDTILVNGWRNLIYLGEDDRSVDRTPGIWIYPGSTNIHFRHSSSVDKNDGQDIVDVGVPIKTWYHLLYIVNTTYIEGYVNGVQKVKRFLPVGNYFRWGQPRERKRLRLFAKEWTNDSSISIQKLYFFHGVVTEEKIRLLANENIF